jgi:small nuclear ribonucleoprotein
LIGADNMDEIQRPLDALNNAKDKRVFVELKNGLTLVGTLKAFDIHINLILDDAEEHSEGELKRKLGKILLRGDNVLVISPE